MFRLKKIHTVRWPVTVQIPMDGGKTQPAEFEVEFRYLDDKQIQDLLLNSEGRNEPILREVLVGWDHNILDDETGQPLPFSADNRDSLIGHAYIANPLVEAFLAMRRGAAAKN